MLYRVETYIECGETTCNYGPGPDRICKYVHPHYSMSKCGLFNTVVIEKSKGIYEKCTACARGVKATIEEHDHRNDE